MTDRLSVTVERSRPACDGEMDGLVVGLRRLSAMDRALVLAVCELLLRYRADNRIGLSEQLGAALSAGDVARVRRILDTAA